MRWVNLYLAWFLDIGKCAVNLALVIMDNFAGLVKYAFG